MSRAARVAVAAALAVLGATAAASFKDSTFGVRPGDAGINRPTYQQAVSVLRPVPRG